MQILLIVIDGVGDIPSKELNNKTPLEAANIPNLNKLAKEGKTGILYPVKENIAPESDIAIIALLGYDPYKYHTGRGPLECVGANLKFENNDIALRTNFATVKDKKILDRRVGRNLTTKESKVLERLINEKVKLPYKFVYKSTISHRGVLLIKNAGLSDNISNTDPEYIREGKFGVVKKEYSDELKKCISLDDDEESKEVASLINSFVEQSHKILDKHPLNLKRERNNLLKANIILTRDAGISLPNFPKKHNWSAVASMPLEVGLAKLTGMKLLEFKMPEIKKDIYKYSYETLKKFIEFSLKNIEDHNKIYIHFKETDIPGHDGLHLEKKKMIEIIDKEFFGNLNLKNKIICVSADHSTPCSLKRHSADPVPVLIYGKDKDFVNKFSEKECKKGKIGMIYGKDLMKLLENE